jgi:hypothetical protein
VLPSEYVTFEGYEFKHLGQSLFHLRCPLGCIVANQVDLEKAYEAMHKHAQTCKRGQGAPPTQTPPRTIND